MGVATWSHHKVGVLEYCNRRKCGVRRPHRLGVICDFRFFRFAPYSNAMGDCLPYINRRDKKKEDGVEYKTPPHSAWSESNVRYQTLLPTAKRNYQENRRWKYGGTLIFKLASIEFLFDRNTNYGSTCNRFHTRNYFRLRRNRKYWHWTLAYLENGSTAVHGR